MPYPKPSWLYYVPWPLVIVGGLLIGLAIVLIMLAASFAEAGGQVQLTWDQSADCAVVTGWELLVAPITTQQPNPQPTTAAVGVSIANTPPPACGLAMQKTVSVTGGVGPSRFWLRSVAGATKSPASNNVDASLPLAPPSGLQLVVP